MKPINRILLTRMKFIGDIVLTTPVIRSLRAHFPDAYIAYMGDKEAVSLLEHNPWLNEIIPFDFSNPAVIEQPRVIFQLRKRKFDVVVDFFGNPRSALLSFITGAPLRIGGDFGTRGKLFTHRVRDDGKPKTAIEFHYQYVKPLGIEPPTLSGSGWRTEVFLTEDERREARIFLQWQDIDLTRPIVGLHPGATWLAKIWLADRFAELANQIVTKLGAQVLITQGPNDGGIVQEVVPPNNGGMGQDVKVLNVLPLRQLAAVLSHCSVYVANDSGPMHIAVAVGTPTIGIFGPGEENIWFPYVTPYYNSSDGHIALRKDVFCHPCHLNVCNREGEGYMECMKLLTVQEVLAEVAKRLTPSVSFV